MGRYVKLTAAKRRQIVTLRAQGKTLHEIAKAVGVSYTSVRTALERPAPDEPAPAETHDPDAPAPDPAGDDALRSKLRELDALMRVARADGDMGRFTSLHRAWIATHTSLMRQQDSVDETPGVRVDLDTVHAVAVELRRKLHTALSAVLAARGRDAPAPPPETEPAQ